MIIETNCPLCHQNINVDIKLNHFKIIESNSKICPHCNRAIKISYRFTYFLINIFLLIIALAIYYYLSFLLTYSLNIKLILFVIYLLVAIMLIYHFSYKYHILHHHIELIYDIDYKDIQKKVEDNIMNQNFIYNIPTKIYFGENQLINLKEELSKYGHKVLMCYGQGSIKKNGLYKRVITILGDEFKIYELANIKSNPDLDIVKKGINICKENQIEVILAIGGGSVIDASKIIAISALSDKDPWDIVLNREKVLEALPILTVLTNSATGSEMNNTAVITNLTNKDKRGYANDLMLPKVSFLDPSLTYSINSEYTAYASIDIFAHVLESYLNPNESLYFLDKFMEGMMKTVIKYAQIAYEYPNNYEARANLMWASSWAVNGFIKEYQKHHWTAHAIGHSLSAYYDMNHGLSLAIVIPRWLRYIKDDKTDIILAKLGRNVFDLEGEDSEIAIKTIEAIEDFFYQKMNIKPNLSDYKIDNTFFIDMAYKACKGDKIDGFKQLVIDDVVEIYRTCL